jgi:ADP-ribosylation factor GTPase-activating protein 2/3
MGVHTTFVRSVDLDEWTQRQIDSMRLGGNGNARAYFRKAGLTDFHGKIDKKYLSKAAQSYRAELAKMIDAEAVKRGEAISEAAAAALAAEEMDDTGTLLDNLTVAEQNSARQKLAAARAANAAPAQSVAVLASQLPNARGKLATPPSSGNAPKLVLRKPANSTSMNMMKKKASTTSSKLRINKLSTSSVSASTSGDDGFEDIEATQKAAAENGVEATQLLADEKLARQMQRDMNNGNGVRLAGPKPAVSASNGAAPPAAAPVAAAPKALSPVPASPAKTLEKKSSMEDNMAKMKAMNMDFFSDM